MTEEEVRALIARGEGQRVEFKAAEADAANLARALAALGNSGGGSLLLGPGEDGAVLGPWYAQPPHITRTIRTLLERGEISERQYRGLLHAREHDTIARREYVAQTGVSERTAANDLADLVQKGLLEPTGGRGRRAAYRLRDGEG